MNWFSSHVYVASWCALLVGVTGLVVKNARPSATQKDWSNALLYITYLTCLAVSVTPGFDLLSRGMARGIVALGFGYLIVQANRR